MLTGKELQNLIKERLYYDKNTGNFHHKKNNGTAKIGDISGTINNRGYLRVRLNRKFYFAHRLVWVYFNGDYPKQEIDHINRNKLDNRIENLRDVSRRENMSNRKLQKIRKEGLVGVYKVGIKWRAVISINNKNIDLGRFLSKEEAIRARRKGEEYREEICKNY